MRTTLLFSAVVLTSLLILTWGRPSTALAGELSPSSGYKVLEPIQHGNLTVFPVIAVKSYDTKDFLTLDEGLRSGEVVVTESGNLSPLVRPRHQQTYMPRSPIGGAQVNQLVLVNNSKRPLILLAGEIVTGGKQDRIIGKDRLVPAESDPVALSVFCVEPGRWTGTTAKFGGFSTTMAQPAIRAGAMADRDQAQVWSEVRNAQKAMAAPLAPPAAMEVTSTSSYAGVMQNEEVKKQVDSIAVPIQRSYESVIKQLRDRNAVGVVVAVNGEIIWADIFASTSLLQKYWPKLVRSYATEAMVNRAANRAVDVKAAQAFLEKMDGTRQVVETEPGLYRHTEITGDTFKAFELTSLLPKTGFDLHIAKMAE